MYCFARDRHQCRGLTIYSGLAGAIIGIFQIVIYAGVSPELVWIVIGGILNFISGLPIYLSFNRNFKWACQRPSVNLKSKIFMIQAVK